MKCGVPFEPQAELMLIIFTQTLYLFGFVSAVNVAELVCFYFIYGSRHLNLHVRFMHPKETNAREIIFLPTSLNKKNLKAPSESVTVSVNVFIEL